MPDGNVRVSKVRLIGLVASVVAFCAIGLTCVADNRDTGFGHRITAAQQVTLLLLAGILVVMQSAAYLMRRRKTGLDGKG